MQSTIDVSVVILSWNDRPHLEICLDSLTQELPGVNLEVIVVDNASNDGSDDLVREKYPTFNLIQHQTNVGFARGNNVGIHESSGKYLCLINSDIKLLDGCLRRVLSFMEENPDIGIAGPRILNADGTHQSSCRRFPTLWNNFCSAVGLATVFTESRGFSGEHMFYFHGDRIIDVDVLVGCFWFVRREALSQFGLLDEAFFMYAEDIDWCRRCWQAGWRVVFFPGACAVHYRGGSSIKQDPVWVALTQQQSILHYWKKHHSRAGLLGITCLMFVHKLVRLVGTASTLWVKPAQRIQNRLRMRVLAICLKALFISQKVKSA